MKPQERIRFFWATGVLPGTIFDDVDAWPPKTPQPPRRSLVKWLKRNSRKRR